MSAGVKCKPAVGAATAPRWSSEQALVIVADQLRVGGPLAGDIGRQGHFAETPRSRVEFGAGEGEGEHHFAFAVVFDLASSAARRQAPLRCAPKRSFAALSFFAGRTKARHRVAGDALMQQRARSVATSRRESNASQPCRDDARVVDDQRIAGRRKSGKSRIVRSCNGSGLQVQRRACVRHRAARSGAARSARAADRNRRDRHACYVASLRAKRSNPDVSCLDCSRFAPQ